MAPPPPPELMEELVEQVLLRFPPDNPASLVRAALVCKLWCRLVSGSAFRRRYREFHRGAAPLLGVLYTSTGDSHRRRHHEVIRDDDDDDTPPRADDDDADSDDDRSVRKRARILREPTAHLVPTTSSYHPAGGGRRNGWRAIDAHHGRVLLCRPRGPLCRRLALSVWDPVTGEQRDLPDAPLNTLGFSAAVVCACAAAGGKYCCDHLDCHFLVVAIDVQPRAIIFSVYSSEAGAWSCPTILEHEAGSLGIMKHTPGILVDGALYSLVHFSHEIVKFDLATQKVSIRDLPPELSSSKQAGSSIVLMTDDGGDDGPGLAVANTKYQLELWSLGTGEDACSRVIDLNKVIPSDALMLPSTSSSSSSSRPHVSGFADGGDSGQFLFMRTSDGIYSIEVNSIHVRKVANCCGEEDGDVVPYIRFCTPMTTSSRVHQKIVPRRPRAKNPRFHGPEWANT